MKELLEQWGGTAFPEMLRNLPEIDVPVEGIRGWLLQSGTSQASFFDIAAHTTLPPHSHCAQWGILVEGEMVLTIGGRPHTIRKGDWYYIPAGVEHSATFPVRVHAIDVFDAPDRYMVK
jgi:quercetin dioxygenase-like cupin family protein